MIRLNTMLNNTILFAVMIALLAGLPAYGAKPAPVYPMRVDFVDVGQNLRSDSVDPNYPASYVDGEQVVLAELRSQGRLQMTTCAQGPKNKDVTCDRFLFVDLNNQVLGSAPSPVYGLPAEQPGPFVTSITLIPIDHDGTELTDGLRAVMNSPGEVRLSRLKINFYTTSSLTGTEVQYTLRFKPSAPDAPDDFVWPDSSFVRVTYLGGDLDCTGGDEGVDGCAAWEVRASNSDERGISTTDIGTLESDNQWDEGDYHFPLQFRISVLPSATGDGGNGGGGNGGGRK